MVRITATEDIRGVQLKRPSRDSDALMWCRIPGTYMGATLDRGQIIRKLHSAKNEQLTRLAYLIDYEPEGDPYVCVECGAEFTEDTFRRGHFEKRHRERTAPLPVRQDRESDADFAERVAGWKEQQDEAEARRLEREVAQMPPNLENTLASR